MFGIVAEFEVLSAEIDCRVEAVAEDLGIVGNGVRVFAAIGDVEASEEGGTVHCGGNLANATAVFGDGAFLFNY